MGILNLTPDSFYESSRIQTTDRALELAAQMLTAGATFLDLGAMSSRPGAQIISPELEWQRLQPGLTAIRNAFPEALLSVDTIHATVAQKAVDAGADLINDISGGTLDASMFGTVARLGVPYILMHMRGTPETMRQLTSYDNLVVDILDDLIKKVGTLRALGATDIILDPGFGFGKTIEQNFDLLRQFHQFGVVGLPLLAGLSRKSMIWKTLNTKPEGALNGTTALHMIALQQGASILRVHDVLEAVQVVQLWEQLGSPLYIHHHSNPNERLA